MTSVRKLRMAAGAGEPDSVLALRIDLVAAAVLWSEAHGDYEKSTAMQRALREDRLILACERYKRAVRRRGL